MSTSTSTFGASIGRALGTTGAYALHGAATAVSYTGRFGADIATGAATGYVETNTRLAAMREAAKAQREFAPIVAPQPTRSIKVNKATV